MATAFRQGEDGHATGAMSTAGRDGYAWWSGLAFVLTGAAALKAHQVATEPHLGTSPFHSRPFLIGAIWLEVLLGIWMLAGLHLRITRWVVIACFGAFAAVALALVLRGAESCGCFGRVHVNPWYTSAFDAAIAVGVWLFPESWSPSPTIFDAPKGSISAWRAEAWQRARSLGALAVWALAHHPDVQQVAQNLGPTGRLRADLNCVSADAETEDAGHHLVGGSRPLADRNRLDWAEKRGFDDE